MVVQVVQGRKEKLKFTAPPPSPPGTSEYKVKPAKKKTAAAPTISKRITSTAVNANVALPTMEMNSSSMPNMMASVMSGLGSDGLGAGASGVGAGMVSMQVSGMTAFGFRGSATGGLTGHLYDLKQTADKKSTDIKDDGFVKDPKAIASMNSFEKWMHIYKLASNRNMQYQLTDSVLNHARVLTQFFDSNWDEHILKHYYQARQPLTAYQWFIPSVSPSDALKAFGVEKEMQPSHFIVHYKGMVTAPKSGMFRFIGRQTGVLAVRFDGRNVFGNASLPLVSMKSFEFNDLDKPKTYSSGWYPHGQWFSVEADKKYPMEILLDCDAGGMTCALMIEEQNPSTTYLKRQWCELYPKDPILIRYPIFALKKGIPAEPYELPSTTPPSGAPPTWRPFEKIPEAAPEPLIFNKN